MAATTTKDLFGGTLFSAGLTAGDADGSIKRVRHSVATALVATSCLAAPALADDDCFGAPQTVDGSFDGAYSVFVSDVDGDGDMDILGAAYLVGDIAWWENTTGDGAAWIEHNVVGDLYSAKSVYAADVDGDGDMDVLGAGYCWGIMWWENTSGDGSVWIEHKIDGRFEGAYSVHAADVDGDGDMDVLGAANVFLRDTGEITWWENTAGDGTLWTEHSVDGDFLGAISVYAADINGDGDMDVLGAAFDDDDITWWENTTGDGAVWIEHTVDAEYSRAVSVYAADIDGDGDMDVLGAALGEDDITWWENTAGDGAVWIEHTVESNFHSPRSVYAADIDGDGDIDILGGAITADDIRWWENITGDGAGWITHLVDSDFSAYSVHAADVDGDGDMDVLGASNLTDDITWWESLLDCAGVDCPADIDGGCDCTVGTQDLIVLLGAWGANPRHPADLDGDGVVNAADLLELLGNWGPCPK